MRRRARRLAAVALALVAFAAVPAGATIYVAPPVVTVGHETQFVVRIQSLRPNAATHAVKILVPEGTVIDAQQPPPLGWSRDPLTRDGELVGVFYKGGSMPADTHIDFRIVARPEVVGDSLWVAEQYYDDGFVEQLDLVPGDPVPSGSDSDGPGAIVRVEGRTATTTPGPAGPGPTADEPAAQTLVQSTDEGRGAAWRLGVLFLVGALIAFIAAAVLLARERKDTPRPLA